MNTLIIDFSIIMASIHKVMVVPPLSRNSTSSKSHKKKKVC